MSFLRGIGLISSVGSRSDTFLFDFSMVYTHLLDVKENTSFRDLFSTSPSKLDPRSVFLWVLCPLSPSVSPVKTYHFYPMKPQFFRKCLSGRLLIHPRNTFSISDRFSDHGNLTEPVVRQFTAIPSCPFLFPVQFSKCLFFESGGIAAVKTVLAQETPFTIH